MVRSRSQVFAALFVLCSIIGYAVLMCHMMVPIGPGIADYHYEIRNGYVVVRCNNKDRSIRRSSPETQVAGSPSRPRRTVIPRDVTAIGWDFRFIACERREFTGAWESERPHFDGFYLIDTTTHEVHGPFLEYEYIEKSKQLGISPPIKLVPTDKHPRAAFAREENLR